jgi:hypothetical protein
MEEADGLNETAGAPCGPGDKMTAQSLASAENTPMRLALVLAIAFAGPVLGGEPDKPPVELSGTIDGRGLPMAECDAGVHRIKLMAKVDTKGEGSGTLVLDATPNPVDEYGFAVTVKAEPLVKLECTLKLVGTKKVLAEGPAVGAPAIEVEWQLYEITGPKIVSKLSLARETRAGWTYALFLWATKEGKNRTVVLLHGPQPKLEVPPPPPCHPGCFPAGTPIQTPGGAKSIEDLRPGDAITTVGVDGKPGQGKIAAMFVTKNQLVQVNIDGKALITTATQPLSLADGKLRVAGELKPGDRIYVWAKGERTTAVVKSVEATERQAQVYNVSLGEPVLFIANGYVARSKPPAVILP